MTIDSRKAIKSITLFFIFLFLSAIVLWEVKLFSNVLGEFFYEKSVASASDSLRTGAIKKPEINPTAQQEKYSNKINAKSFISVRIKKNKTKEGREILFSQNEEEKLPIASLTKLMTTLVVFKNYDLSEKIIIGKSADSQVDQQSNLKEGEIFSVENLLYMTLIESNNMATELLSEVVGENNFIGLMNAEAQKLNLINTHFEDTTGLNSKSYSTADDLAKLSEYLFKNYPLFSKIIGLKEFNLYLDDGSFHHKLVNTNKLLGEVDGVIGGKTGWTDIARGCFMIISRLSGDDDYFIHIILGAEDRFLEMEKLISAVDIK